MFTTKFAAALLVMVAASTATPAVAQTYPSGPLRIVVPFTPGGGTDILARILGQKLTESWGQPVVVDNRAGASGTVGTAVVARFHPTARRS